MSCYYTAHFNKSFPFFFCADIIWRVFLYQKNKNFYCSWRYVFTWINFNCRLKANLFKSVSMLGLLFLLAEVFTSWLLLILIFSHELRNNNFKKSLEVRSRWKWVGKINQKIKRSSDIQGVFPSGPARASPSFFFLSPHHTHNFLFLFLPNCPAEEKVRWDTSN